MSLAALRDAAMQSEYFSAWCGWLVAGAMVVAALIAVIRDGRNHDPR